MSDFNNLNYIIILLYYANYLNSLLLTLISVWCYERPADFCGKVYTHQERQRHCGTEGYGSTLKNELFEAIEVRIRRWTSQLLVVVAFNLHFRNQRRKLAQESGREKHEKRLRN